MEEAAQARPRSTRGAGLARPGARAHIARRAARTYCRYAPTRRRAAGSAPLARRRRVAGRPRGASRPEEDRWSWTWGGDRARARRPGTVAHRIGAAIESVIEGKPDAVRLALTVLLAEGHVLIEDVPGVGKTMLAKALARSTDCSVRRIQFTPDLLPSDITGVSAFNQERREFEFKPGPVFANIVVGDEINRASPKTQSALLECMEERQVTVDGTDLPAGTAVHGHRHPEPDGDGGHLPAARGAAGPVHRAHLHGLPERRAAELAMLDMHGSAFAAGLR